VQLSARPLYHCSSVSQARHYPTVHMVGTPSVLIDNALLFVLSYRS
jgi:hypothetical protein